MTLPGWKRDVGRHLDALICRSVPGAYPRRLISLPTRKVISMRTVGASALVLSLVLGSVGCAAVKPYEREKLAGGHRQRDVAEAPFHVERRRQRAAAHPEDAEPPLVRKDLAGPDVEVTVAKCR